MTALDLLTALDARPVRPSTPAARTGSPGATAFAEAVRDAVRETASPGPGATDDPGSAAETTTEAEPAATVPVEGAATVSPLLPAPPTPAGAGAPLVPALSAESGRTSGDDGDTHGGLASAPPVRRRAGRPPRTRRGHGGRRGDARLRGDRGYPLLRLAVRRRGRRGGPAPPDVGAAGRTVSGPGDRPTGPAAPHPGSRDRRSRAPRHRRRERDGHRTGRLPAPSLHGRAGSHVDRALDLCCRGDDRRRRGPGTGGTLDPRIGRPAGRGPAERRSRGRGGRCRPEPRSPPPLSPPAAPPSAVAAPARPALLPQVAAPVVSLAQAPDGDHRITLTVSPENLGPVTVRALIAGSTIRIELHAPGELGRDALRAILGDLRRDLAIAAPQATLSLTTSDGSPSSPQHGGTGGQTGNGGADAQRHQAAARASAVPPTPAEVPPPPPPAPPVAPLGGIDVYA
ncbi:flagellar hook-length control protein FliK [Microbacterium sp. NRRL B-14842]|uniref:flagellar hook-length control protein FliK n=1 Tax=Microbacterium sp. NRRL B-14842 TaxID=3162881 RepID=UPI003D265D27